MEQNQTSSTVLDEMVENSQTRMIKAAVPYLPPQGRKILSVYAKLTELRNTLTLFRPETQAMSTGETAADPVEMLEDIREHCGGAVKQEIDQILNFFVMTEMMKIMKENPQEKGEDA